MTLIHYSDRPLMQVRTVAQANADRSPAMKPQGLWVSVHGEFCWRSWCEAEGFNSERLTVATEVILSKDANILYIKNLNEFHAFVKEYVTPSSNVMDHTIPYRPERVDWPRVAERYDGIIIAPYQWSERMRSGSIWYYPWDCASGCIWNANAVAMLRPAPEYAVPLKEPEVRETEDAA